MSKVITFSRQFPVYHPRKGEPTYFTEKLNKSLPIFEYGIIFSDLIHNDIPFFNCDYYETCEPKYHTIRAGNRWKVGDKFSPRVWSGKPYCSKQIIIAPDIEIKKVWEIVIERNVEWIGDFNVSINGIPYTNIQTVAMNDGLEMPDFISWFNKKVFIGQIICWNNKIDY